MILSENYLNNLISKCVKQVLKEQEQENLFYITYNGYMCMGRTTDFNEAMDICYKLAVAGSNLKDPNYYTTPKQSRQDAERKGCIDGFTNFNGSETSGFYVTDFLNPNAIDKYDFVNDEFDKKQLNSPISLTRMLENAFHTTIWSKAVLDKH